MLDPSPVEACHCRCCCHLALHQSRGSRRTGRQEAWSQCRRQCLGDAPRIDSLLAKSLAIGNAAEHGLAGRESVGAILGAGADLRDPSERRPGDTTALGAAPLRPGRNGADSPEFVRKRVHMSVLVTEHPLRIIHRCGTKAASPSRGAPRYVKGSTIALLSSATRPSHSGGGSLHGPCRSGHTGCCRRLSPYPFAEGLG